MQRWQPPRHPGRAAQGRPQSDITHGASNHSSSTREAPPSCASPSAFSPLQVLTPLIPLPPTCRSSAAPCRAMHRRRAPLAARAASTTDILTKEDLVNYIAGGCKPKEDWRSAALSSLCTQRNLTHSTRIADT